MLTQLLGRRLQGKLGFLPSFAAAMAYYFLVALVPFLIVVSRGASTVFSSNLTPELLAFMREILPPESAFSMDAVTEALGQGSNRLAAASTVLAIWTASSGINEMTRAVHFLFSDPDKPSAGGLRRRGKAFGVLAIWVLAIIGVAVSFVVLPALQRELGGVILPRGLTSGYRYPAAFTMLFAAFASTYVFVPQKSPSWRAASAGAGIAAASWSAVSLLFSYFLPHVWHVSLFHGALSSVLAVLIWAYCGAWGVLLGAVVTVRVDEK